jgi:hypothetical protein
MRCFTLDTLTDATPWRNWGLPFVSDIGDGAADSQGCSVCVHVAQNGFVDVLLMLSSTDCWNHTAMH